MLARKTFVSTMVGHEPVSLPALLDRARWAVDHPGAYHPHYLDDILQDVRATENILANILMVLSWQIPGDKKPLLYQLATKKPYRRK
jgi:hypothetical protein